MSERYVPPTPHEALSAAGAARNFSSFMFLLSISLVVAFAIPIIDDFQNSDGQQAKEALPYFALFAAFALVVIMIVENKRADIAMEEYCQKYRSYP